MRASRRRFLRAGSWRKVFTVATFELMATVKRPGYLIATFGMPLFMAAYAGIVAIPAYYAVNASDDSLVQGIVDEAGVLRLGGDVTRTPRQPPAEELRRRLEQKGQTREGERALKQSPWTFRPFAQADDARAALVDRSIKGYFVIPADYVVHGRIDAYHQDSISLSASDAREALEGLIRERLVEQHAPSDMAVRIVTPIERTQRFAVTRSGEVRDGGAAAAIVRILVPVAFMVLFLLSILMTSGYLMQGTATEKENKVVEVLLASADPDQILAGKLLGLGAAGLLQIAVWLSMASVTTLGIVPLLISSRVDLPWAALALAIPFFIVAFLFFGGLILGTGSLGTNMREAQQLAMVWSLTAALPLMLMAVLLREPHGTLARVLTWVPFTAGPVVVLRASTDAALLAWWEVAGSFLVLLAATWLGLRVGARLFRVGLLSVGSRPSLREIIRQARLA